MEESHIQRQHEGAPPVSARMDARHEEVRLKVPPKGNHQMKSSTKIIIVILVLFSVVLLVALVVAVVTVFQLKATIHKLEQAQLTTASGAQPTTASSATISPLVTNQTSCADILSSNPSAPGGVYTIHIGGRVQGRAVWCDMVTGGGGWTMFQRRQDGSVRFNRTWTEYSKGFGSADAEFWLGNDDIHALTSAQPSELRIELSDWQGNHTYAIYSNFRVDSMGTNYTLHVSGYTGTAGDSLTPEHNSQQFSTIGRDNDGSSNSNCATDWGGGGGWWYGACHTANLNGWYFLGGVNDERGLEWSRWPGHPFGYSLKASAMMVRPRK